MYTFLYPKACVLFKMAARLIGVCVCIYIYIYIRVCIPSCILRQLELVKCLVPQSMRMCTLKYGSKIDRCAFCMYVCMYMCMYAYAGVHFVCMYVYMYV